MTNFNHVEVDEVHTPSSDSSFQHGNMLSNPGMFSYYQTEPGSTWDTTAEGTQNFNEFTNHGELYIADQDELVPFAQNTPRLDQTSAVDDLQSKWGVAASAEIKAPRAEPMRRMTSSRSSASSHKHRALKAAASRKGRPRLSTLSAAAAPHYANLDVTTAHAGLFQDPSFGSGRIMDPQQYLAQDLDTLSVSSHASAPAFHPAIMGLATDGLPYMEFAVAQHVNPTATQIFNPHMPGSSPRSWDSLSSRSSPTPGDDGWSVGPPVTSPADTHGSSPAYLSQSPSVSRNLDASQVVASQDLRGNVLCDDGFSLPPPSNPRRLSGEGESARDHHLYKNVLPGVDGLFHCPWEGVSSCNHKPEKLKCNYDKFVDSHLKPYRCKAESCENSRFSSTACLLRHEREAHAMHGHGDKPYLCTYEGCERSNQGNGFPRQWNLRDHMRRVHNDNGSSAQPPPANPPPPPANNAKGRKRKKDAAQTPSSRKSSSKSAQGADPSPKVVPHPDTIQWQEHKKAIQSLVQGFNQPDDPQFLHQVKDAQGHLTAMGKISREIISSQNADLLRGNYRHTWAQD